MRNAFVNAGLLPDMRLVSDEQEFRLHNEIRDLLLAYARYKKWLDAKASQDLHKKLADVYAQRYQRQPQIQWLLERLYHQLMLEDDADLESVNEPPLLFSMAVDLEAEKQYIQMIQVLLRLIDLQPDYEDAWFGLGVALGWQGQLAEAVAAYRKQVEIKPDHDNAWYNLGVVLARQGQLVEAVTAYRKQIEVKPDHDKAWNNLGVALGQQGQLDEEVIAYRKQVEVKPDYDKAWYNLGVVLSQQGKLAEAQQAYAQVIRLNPNDLSALSNDAELALMQQDTRRCLERIHLAWADNQIQHYAILPFLAWLADPASSHQAVWDAIQNLDASVKIDWDFSGTEPAIARLSPEQQQIARQFVAWFEGKKTDLSGL